MLAAGAWEKEAQRKQREPSLPPQAPVLCPSRVLDPTLPGATLSSVWLRRKPATAPNASPGGSHARAGVSFPSIFFQPLPVRARLGGGGWGEEEGKMDGVGAERPGGRQEQRRKRMAKRRGRKERREGRGRRGPRERLLKEVRKNEKGGEVGVMKKAGASESEDRGAQKKTGRGEAGMRKEEGEVGQDGCKGTEVSGTLFEKAGWSEL